MRFRLLFAVIAVFFFASALRADTVAVTLSGADWLQIAPNTFVLPADLTTGIVFCGMENEPECEPIGSFSFNVAFAGVPNLGNGQQPVSYAILDPNGAVSDFIGLGNQNGHGVVFFASDPLATVGPITPVGTVCTESDTNGCVGSLILHTTNGSAVTLLLATDGENSFDPFGAGFDISDGLKVTANAPEPGSFALVATGLVGLAGLLRKKFRSR
jgi:PEP-CTERM motif